MSAPPHPSPWLPKKPKTETIEEEEVGTPADENGRAQDDNSRKEQEEALVALIEHRTKEVEHLRNRISYYQSQVSSSFLVYRFIWIGLVLDLR